ncbi:MAG: nodulation protein NfeD, partial [Silvibacterium sp.]
MSRSTTRAVKCVSTFCLLMATTLASAQSRGVSPQVVVLHLDDTIQPVSEQYLERGLTQAAQNHSDALLIDLNTPGGLLDTTRSMVSKILASPV